MYESSSLRLGDADASITRCPAGIMLISVVHHFTGITEFIGIRDGALGANLRACAAARAFVVIDNGQIVLHHDRVFGTLLGAEAARDTARFAVDCHRFALIGRAAADKHVAILRHYFYHVLGACLGALAAACADGLIHSRNAFIA